MKKTLFLFITGLSTAVALIPACRKADPVIRKEQSNLADIYLTTQGAGKDRLFNPRYSNDTVYFDVPWFYPATSDNNVDITKMIVRATIPGDASISPSLGGVMDLTKPLTVTITAGNGAQSKYVIMTKKVGDLSVNSAKISLTNGGTTEEIEGVVQANEILFYVMPGTNVSNATLTYDINKHSKGSITYGASINLSSNVPFSVTGVDGVVKTYTLRALEPVKLAYGVGINRKLWNKPGAELGFTANNEVCLAVSGDNLVLTRRTTPAKFSVFNRFTGAYIKDMYNPFTATNFQVINDSADHLLAASWAPKNSKFILYRYNDVNDAAPVKLVEWTNNNPAAITGDGGVGRRVNVYGDLNGDAVIMAPAGQSAVIYKWRIVNGVAVSQTPEVITYKSITGGSSVFMGYYAEAQPIGTGPNADYFINYQFEVALVNGTTHERTAGFAAMPNVVFTMPTAYNRFNNANYLSIVKYINTYDLNKVQMSLFDVTRTSSISMAPGSPDYGSFNVFNSEELNGTANGNGTADIAVGYSNNKERMQVYMLLTNGGIMAHEFTNYAP
ncbi:DUF5018 domain-containing protein [Paraflavitalea speifideaquila]|uniref:DUF5018 domain-containing protein n=1 Tax=Paraflavitalea speifideaquila TaxID=3076558 RepID=UPI0028E3C3BC|nr:DUF5018 domain-containing protein [Paraflavitalea speifideiaquila]